MLIDWFTVCAQAINFLILVWLLKRYLYKPVLAAIDARERKVAARIVDAETQEKKTQAASDDIRKRNEAFDQEREGLMRKATDEGAAERQASSSNRPGRIPSCCASSWQQAAGRRACGTGPPPIAGHAGGGFRGGP